MMAVMASRKHEKKKKKNRLHPNLYDGYAIYCDQDRAKITNLLRALNRLGLRVHCKDNVVCGERMFDAIVKKGILASKCCLVFVSTHFLNDPLCVYFSEVALLKYVTTNRKHRIITICLDHTKIPCLGIFKEISIKNFSCGTIPEIILDERLLCIIYKAMKGPEQKTIHHNWKRFHYHVPYSFKQKKKKKLLKSVKKSKFSRFTFLFVLKGNVSTKIIDLGYIICKCFFDSFLWRKLIKLATCPQVYPIIQHYFPTNIRYHLLRQCINNCPSIPNLEEQLSETRQSVCKYCSFMVLTSELNRHESECWKPDNCESCGRLISRAQKQQHENMCIFEECFICCDFHPPSHDCSTSDLQAIGICEDLDTSLQDDFSSLSCIVTLKCTVHPDVKKIVDKLMEVVARSLSSKKKKKKLIEDQFNELTDLVHQLLEQLKHHKIIDQHTIGTICETMEHNLVPIVFSAKSINYFRNFVYAVELHCAKISLFEEQPLFKEVMCAVPPQPKKGFLDRFRISRSSQNNRDDSGQVFPPLMQNLFQMNTL